MRIASGLAKLLVDIYIYWNFTVSINYLYKEFKETITKEPGEND